jgi:hypothetical protein
MGDVEFENCVSMECSPFCRWDPTLVDWPENDFRIFVGDMGPEVSDEVRNPSVAQQLKYALYSQSPLDC